MFDRSFLSPAQTEFVVLSDTHYMLDPGNQPVEFESRRLQTARAEHALRLAAALAPAFMVHLGDLVQAYPGEETFAQALAEAGEQLARCGVQPYHVAGNHDVGDKPDPTAPTDWVTPASLALYHDRYGRSWYSWDQAGIHGIVLNSQIMNSDLPEATEQQRWLEADLREHAGQRICLFLHLPPFLENEHEPALGHYDNLAEPARGWLLHLIRQYQVELVMAGHTHFAFAHRIGPTRYFIAPSTSFSRPGFSEVFSSCPPPERGRNDTAKLGFMLVRVHADGMRLHFIRTDGEDTSVDEATPTRRVLTRTARDLPESPLGIHLRHPLAHATEVPSAWPSVIRQRVRNDYPLLACIELGVRHLRVPASDLGDPLQHERLAMLRDEGVQITASWVWSESLDLPAMVAQQREKLDGVEIILPGTPWPGAACLEHIRHCQTELGTPVTLSTAIPGERVPGKQHNRTRLGYRAPELPALNQHLARHHATVDRVLCRVDSTSPWEVFQQAMSWPSHPPIGAVDWLAELPPVDPFAQAVWAAETAFAAALLRHSRLFFDPLLDLDRTMDASFGLLDRLANPRLAFHVLRMLNTLLFSAPQAGEPVAGPAIAGAKVLGLAGPGSTWWLLLPASPSRDRCALNPALLPGLEGKAGHVFDLERGTRCPLPATQAGLLHFNTATLIMVPANAEISDCGSRIAD